MDWNTAMKTFKSFLQLERSLSGHSIDAYLRDVSKLERFDMQSLQGKGPLNITRSDIESFVNTLFDLGVERKSQARIISGNKAFYKYLQMEDLISENPMDHIVGPKLQKKLPTTLTYEEVRAIIDHMDMSQSHAHRNRAIIEVLYACGIRVSELTELKMSFVYTEDEIIRVIGKNNKERLIPIARSVLEEINLYLDAERKHINVKKGHEDYIFLNRRGRKLSRVMIFNIVKQAAATADIKKNVSPHTFRHSFATHLVEGGADLRAVQDMLGHESITTTEIYTHVDTNYLRETLILYHPHNKFQ